MSRFEQIYSLATGLDHDLWDKPGVLFCGEQRLDPIGLGTDTVDETNARAVRKTIDVVAARETVSGGKCSRKQHAIGTLNGHEMLADHQGSRPIVLQPRIKAVQ